MSPRALARPGRNVACRFDLLVAILALTSVPVAAQALSSTVITDYILDAGSVESMAVAGSEVWLAGPFQLLYRPTAGLARVDTQGGALAPTSTAMDNGTVTCAVADGNGGWFIGGTFYSVGGLQRTGVAHLLADGSADASWNALLVTTQSNSAPPSVSSLALSNGVLYVGGNIIGAGNEIRSGIVALDAATAAVLPWTAALTPVPSFPVSPAVLSILVHQGTIYLAGVFTGVGGQPRIGLAAVDEATGAVLPWYPGAATTPLALAASGNTVWIGGSFTTVGGVARGHLAAAGATGAGALLPWAPTADGNVRAIAASGNAVFAAGDFTLISGAIRERLAAIDPTTGVVTSWDASVSPDMGQPLVHSLVDALELTPTTLRIAGTFTTAGGAARRGLAELALTTAAATSWNPSAATLPQTIVCASGAAILVRSTGMDARPRKSLAALDLATRAPIEGTPTVTGTVHAVARSGGTLFLGGQFTAINGIPRTNLAALDLATGTVLPWNPGTAAYYPSQANRVLTLTAARATLYVMGVFDYVGGLPRSHAAAIDIATGATLPWNLSPGYNTAAQFRGATVVEDVVWLFGSFADFGRRCLVAVDAVTGATLPFNAMIGGGQFVSSIAFSESTVYFSGDFDSVAGMPRLGLAEMTTDTSTLTPWNPGMMAPGPFGGTPVYPGAAMGMVIAGPSLIAGGTFVTAGGVPRNGLVELDRVSATPTAWAPLAPGGTSACDQIINGELFVRGNGLRSFAFVKPAASVTEVGPGCGPTLPYPVLSASTAPVIGTTWSWLLTATPDSFGQLYASFVPPAPVDLGGGCLTYLGLSSLLLLGEFTTDPSGTASSTVGIPLIPAAWGLTLRVQGGVLLPGSFALSAGQELVLGY